MIGKRERIAAMEVLCTNGVKSVMLDLIPAFEPTSGTKIVITWGSTNGLLKDLERRAAGDLPILTPDAIDDLPAPRKGGARTPRHPPPPGVGPRAPKRAHGPLLH